MMTDDEEEKIRESEEHDTQAWNPSQVEMMAHISELHAYLRRVTSRKLTIAQMDRQAKDLLDAHTKMTKPISVALDAALVAWRAAPREQRDWILNEKPPFLAGGWNEAYSAALMLLRAASVEN